MFAKKLDYLMRLTGATNSSLAHALVMDASHISRLRRGERDLPKRQSFLAPMSLWFARQIRDDYQKTALKDLLFSDQPFPQDLGRLQAAIFNWLSQMPENNSSITSFIRSVSDFSPARSVANPAGQPSSATFKKRTAYYGREGKRDAVLRFLTEVLEAPAPRTLHLFSDESMQWLVEDSSFARKWGMLLSDCLKKGNRIQIVHTLSRNIDEMLAAITKWVPIYISGEVEPYYYPKLRDGIYRRTLFVAPGLSAVSASAVQELPEQMLNLYFSDLQAVDALDAEFSAYLALCKPLMRIFNTDSAPQFWQLAMNFEENRCAVLSLRDTPSIMTMPEDVARSLNEKSTNEPFFPIWSHSRQQFMENITHHKVVEILSIPAPGTSGVFYSPYGVFAEDPALLPDLARRHLLNMADLMTRYPNYRVILRDNAPQNIILHAREGIGVLISRTAFPSTAFAINEPSLTAAIWEYLWLIHSSGSQRRQATISALRAAAAGL